MVLVAAFIVIIIIITFSFSLTKELEGSFTGKIKSIFMKVVLLVWSKNYKARNPFFSCILTNFSFHPQIQKHVNYAKYAASFKQSFHPAAEFR